MSASYEEVLAWANLICATEDPTEHKRFGALTPLEVEAMFRDAYRHRTPLRESAS